MHFGILGMKWGIRRYQNKDGSLTPAGKKRYSEKASLDKGLLNKNAKNAEKTPSDRMSEELQGLKLVEDDGRHFTQEYVDIAERYARDHDIYNLNFLEAVQNEPFENEDRDLPESQTTRLKEYRKFLIDPMNYEAPEKRKREGKK